MLGQITQMCTVAVVCNSSKHTNAIPLTTASGSWAGLILCLKTLSVDVVHGKKFGNRLENHMEV